MYVYFPSCNCTRQLPEVSTRIKAWLSGQGVEVTGCCRVSHDKLAVDAVPITICETCHIIISENHPELSPLSLWEFLDSAPDFPFPDYHSERITLQDCYRAKSRATEKRALRSLLRKMNVDVVELPGLEEELNFDGEWLWKPVSPANLRLAPARFAEIGRDVTLKSDTEREEALRSYCGRFETERVACCCNACLSGLEIGLGREGRAVHMAQLLFPETAG